MPEPTTPPPQLGYGKPKEATIDQVNQWMRSQPWWAELRGAPGTKMTDSQKRQIMKAAQANGVVVDEGDMEIDTAGNLNPKGHKLRNTLIVAGIAAAAIAAPYAIPALGSALGGGTGAGLTLAGVEGGTAGISAGTVGALGGGAMGAAAIPTAATVGAGLTGAGVGGLSATSLGLPVTAVPTAAGTVGTGAGIAGLGTGAMGTTAVPSVLGGTAGTAGTVAGTAGAAGTAWDAAGNFVGDSTVNNLAGTTNYGKYIDAARDFAGMASDWEQGREQARDQAGLAAYRQNLANEARFRSMMESRKLALDAPQKRADNSLRGDRLANTQDFHMSIPGIPEATTTGGFRPSMWSENTRQLGKQMSADALAGSGTDELVPEPLERAPEPNVLDTALNMASITAPYLRRKRPYAPGTPVQS